MFIRTIATQPDAKVYSDLEWAGIDHKDRPDYCDAYVVSGKVNGREMTEEDLEEFFMSADKYDELMKHLY